MEMEGNVFNNSFFLLIHNKEISFMKSAEF